MIKNIVIDKAILLKLYCAKTDRMCKITIRVTKYKKKIVKCKMDDYNYFKTYANRQCCQINDLYQTIKGLIYCKGNLLSKELGTKFSFAKFK